MPIGIRATVVHSPCLTRCCGGPLAHKHLGRCHVALAVLSHLLIAGVRPQGAFVSPLLAAVGVVLIVLYVGAVLVCLARGMTSSLVTLS